MKRESLRLETMKNKITLRNDSGDEVVVTRNEEQRSDDNIERTITLNRRKY